MLQTLPLVLFIVMAEVSIGAVSVLVFLDWRNEVKRGFLISYALIYLFLAGLTYWFQQGFATPALLNTYAQLDKAWTGLLSLPLLLFFLLLIPYSLFLLLDKKAGVQSEKAHLQPVETTTTPQELSDMEEDLGVQSPNLGKAVVARLAEPVTPKKGPSALRILRLLSGVATVAAGLFTLFTVAMIFRPLGGSNLGGLFTVASFFAATFALGGVMTAMWLGHWYLVTPALSERPLKFSTSLVLIAVMAQVIFFIVSGPATTNVNQPAKSQTPVTAQVTPAPGQVKPAGAPVVAPLSAGAIGWIRVLVAFIMPLVLGSLAWILIRGRSFQSATGMLYLVVVCALAGEIMSRGLFLVGLS